MATGSGLGGSLGIGQESTWGTTAVPDRWFEFNSESLKLEKKVITSDGVKAGARYSRAARRAVSSRMASGDVAVDVSSKKFGLLFKHCLGSPAAAIQIATTGVYRQTHVPGTMSNSLTLQKGVPESSTGTVRAHTYVGAKVKSWELSVGLDEFLNLKLDVDAKDEDVVTALTAPAYDTGTEMFHSGQLTATIGGTATTSVGVCTIAGSSPLNGLKGFSLKGENSLANERIFANALGLKTEQIENGYRQLSGSLDAEYWTKAQLYDLFRSDASTPLMLTFTGTTGIGTGSGFPLVSITLAAVRFDEGSPGLAGPDVVGNEVNFTVLDDGANTVVQIVYESTDVAP